jgi:hypothetical protein
MSSLAYESAIEGVLVVLSPHEALRRALPLPSDFGIDDLTDDERDAFLATVEE